MFKFFRQLQGAAITNKLLTAVAVIMLLTQNACADYPDHNGQRFYAKVVAVADGDTIRVIDSNGQKHKLRLSYIDAPELNQAGGQDSRQALNQWIYRQQVLVEVFDVDRYRRKVARIRLNGEDINLKQIQTGHAWHYQSIAKKQQNPSDYRLYQQAQQQSQQARLGLWQNKKAIAPWQFRQKQRRQHD